MMLLFGLSLLFSVALCVHAVRSGQEQFWLWIILMFQPVGGLVYVAAVLLPQTLGGRTARRMSQAARDALDPNRAYREALQAHADSPTVANKMRLASTAAGLGRWDEAEELYGEAARGIHAEDPALLLGRAVALIELGRFDAALAQLDVLGQDPDKGRTPAAAVALGRAYEGLGRFGEADTAYQWAAGRLPGLEGLGRYAAFLARTGQRRDAEEIIAEMDKRIAKARGPFKAEARAWRSLAAEALG